MERRVIAAVLIPLFALLIAVASFAALTRETVNEEQLVTHTRGVRTNIRHTLLVLLDAETGVRGYLITAQPDYLTPYDQAIVSLPSAMTQLSADVADNPAQTDRVRQLEPLAQREMQLFDTLRTAPPGRADLTVLTQSKTGMDDLRQRLDAMDAAELELLAERTTRLDELRAGTTMAIGASLVLGVMGAIVAFRLFRRLLAEEATARAEAEAAVHLRDDFLSIAAHELKNPMTTLYGTAQLELRRLSRSTDTEATRAQAGLETIVDQTRKLVRLIEQLLDVSRLQGGKLKLEPETTNLSALVEGVAVAAGQRGSRHEVRVHAPADVSAVVDPMRLEQVLTNLVDNAIKFSPNDEPIEIDLTQPTSTTARISVTDHGIGIPPEQRAQIFQAYYQAQPQAGVAGLGLGLYVSRQIVELHHGTIRAEFPDDGGTRFVIEIPTGPAARA